MPRNRKSLKKQSQKARKERRNTRQEHGDTQNGHANTAYDESNTQTEDSIIQNEQSDAQQRAHKERIRALVDSFIFGTWPPRSTPKDCDPVTGSALGNERANEPEIVTHTKHPKLDICDLKVCSAPGCGRLHQADAAMQRMEPLLSESDDASLVEPVRTREAPLDLAEDGFGGVVGDPLAHLTQSSGATGNASTWAGTRSVSAKATHSDTDTVCPPRPSWESRGIAALPSHTRAEPTPCTPTARIERNSEVAATPQPAVTRNALHSPLSQLPAMAPLTPTERLNNFPDDTTPPPPNIVFDTRLASPPPSAFAGRRYVRRPM
ncbi:hypothetical protein FN846DRAFT_886180 [Sphaerosporella brunnea]|uniref:Uncharacterized protein n=1 Tax=Sphaerosporella brunnea TaxID=1250544 RepID=A0A5J5F9S7_9PEZI|nr:hypothetical protein FN846DRAFT_886180 [Sphaerosporella brunnea]